MLDYAFIKKRSINCICNVKKCSTFLIRIITDSVITEQSLGHYTRLEIVSLSDFEELNLFYGRDEIYVKFTEHSKKKAFAQKIQNSDSSSITIAPSFLSHYDIYICVTLHL